MPIYRSQCEGCGASKPRTQARFCRACSGRFRAKEERNAAIADAFLTRHATIRELAAEYGLTFQRIQQILDRYVPGDRRAYRRVWDRNQRDRIYAESQTTEEFAAKSNISLNAARIVLRRNHKPLLPPQRRVEVARRYAEVARLYKAGVRPKDIRAMVGFAHVSTVYHALRQVGVTERQQPQKNARSR